MMFAMMDNLVSRARTASRDPRECRKAMDALRAIGFFDDGGDAFKQLHHQGGSETRFYSYCGGVGLFNDDDNNHRVHQRLKFIQLSCPGGAPPKGKSFHNLAEEAVRLIPPIP